MSQARQFIIDVWISPEMLQGNITHDKIVKYKFRGLLDIGAAKSSISRDIVQQINLQASGKELLYSASGVSEVDIYNAIVSIPIMENDSRTHVKAFNLNVAAVTTGKEFEMIVGMDILEHCLLVVDGQNFILSY